MVNAVNNQYPVLTPHEQVEQRDIVQNSLRQEYGTGTDACSHSELRRESPLPQRVTPSDGTEHHVRFRQECQVDDAAMTLVARCRSRAV